MRSVIIYGASNPDVVKVLEEMMISNGPIFIQGFLDDTLQSGYFLTYPILGGREAVKELSDKHLFINNVAASTKARMTVQRYMAECRMMPVIWPRVNTRHIQFGAGVMIAEGVQFGAGVMIGSHCVVRMGTTICHEVILDDFVFVAPRATICGRVKIGKGAYIGAGAVVRENTVVGAGAVIGAGAVVVKDVPSGMTVVGNPAKLIQKNGR